MVKIRLTRFGAKKAPFYRIVAVDSRSPRNSDYIELVGTYDPMTNPASVRIDAEIAKKWLNCGAQPTDTVKHLLAKQGIIPEFKSPAKTGKTKKKEG